MKTNKVIDAIQKVSKSGEIKILPNGQFRLIYHTGSGTTQAAQTFEVRKNKLFRIGMFGYADQFVSAL
jgi:phage I-like protein